MSLKKRTKFEMVLTVSVVLLAVVSVGVSTFAWFQANADVNIQADSTSTTITVSKPDEYTFYYYNGNHDGKNNEGTTIYADFPYGTVTGGGDSGKSGYSTNSLSLVDGELHFAS